MKLKAITITGLIMLSLIPVYMLYKYLQRVMRPKETLTRFVCWLLASFALIFGYTFLVVFTIRLLFPGA